MKPVHHLIPAGLGLLLVACASTRPAVPRDRTVVSFGEVRTVLEGSCVHCHGSQRLAGMPPFGSSSDLAALTGPGRLIVPGFPEQSRFFHVVTLSDNEIGAMPPTGHALTPQEVEVLRNWISAGANVPAEEVVLKPHGQSPRSR